MTDFESKAREVLKEVAAAYHDGQGGLDTDQALAALVELKNQAVREAYNDVWQSFKQQYGGTKWGKDGEIDRWLRSFVVFANITPEHFNDTQYKSPQGGSDE